MIIINFKGGLGNQMFQYAFGRKLSIKNNVPLLFDTTGYDRQTGDTNRAFTLDKFNIDGKAASPEEIQAMKYPFGPLSKAWRLIKAKVFKLYYVEFNEAYEAWRGTDLYLDGYFQDEKYFKDIRDTLLYDFVVKNQMGVAAKQKEELLKSLRRAGTSPVLIHVRRGDYVSDATINKTHGTCGPEYYQEAIRALKEKTGGQKAAYFLISDDMAWAKEHIAPLVGSEELIPVSNPEIKDYEELALMSECDHFIIGNSTFSWWIAWLGEKATSIVIAPSVWTRKLVYPRGPIPERWDRI